MKPIAKIAAPIANTPYAHIAMLPAGTTDLLDILGTYTKGEQQRTQFLRRQKQDPQIILRVRSGKFELSEAV